MIRRRFFIIFEGFVLAAISALLLSTLGSSRDFSSASLQPKPLVQEVREERVRAPKRTTDRFSCVVPKGAKVDKARALALAFMMKDPRALAITCKA